MVAYQGHTEAVLGKLIRLVLGVRPEGYYPGTLVTSCLESRVAEGMWYPPLPSSCTRP